MATATLVEAGANRLRYLIAHEGTGVETVVITTIGGASPDTLTDSIGSGTIKEISKVVADGYAQFAAGAQTQAKAKALWLSDWSGADPGNAVVPPTAVLRLTKRSGTFGVFSPAVNVNAGNPEITITMGAGTGDGFLDIEVPGTIGD